MIQPSSLFIQITFSISASLSISNDITWKTLNEGLYFAEVIAPIRSDIGDSRIILLKIDPKYYQFHLLSSKENQTENKTVKEWAEEENLMAVINAGMFQMDFKTNVGYMKNYNFVNNGNLNKDNTILAFNRKSSAVPEIQIIDLKCQDWNILKDAYHSFSQGIRMIDCNQQNRWKQQEKKFSIACIAVDREGFVLFILSRSPYSGHDLIMNLLRLPLNLYNAMYLEGGPEASLYIKYGKFEYGVMGSYEVNFNENDDNDFFWKIPNVIGIRKNSQCFIYGDL